MHHAYFCCFVRWLRIITVLGKFFWVSLFLTNCINLNTKCDTKTVIPSYLRHIKATITSLPSKSPKKFICLGITFRKLNTLLQSTLNGLKTYLLMS